jgi:glutamine amidotransferase
VNVSILDYGTGNLHSLSKALEMEGARVTLVDDPAVAAASDAVVLPGVGAFGNAAARLRDTGLLTSSIRAGLPCLGICLGMQLLYESSAEGAGAGLGLLSGTSRRIRAARLPHMGWNDVEPIKEDPLIEGVASFVAYYANSFVVEPADDAHTVAYTTYDGDRFPAVVRWNSVWGVQFHPEKSGPAGIRMLRNFLRTAGAR